MDSGDKRRVAGWASWGLRVNSLFHDIIDTGQEITHNEFAGSALLAGTFYGHFGGRSYFILECSPNPGTDVPVLR